MVLRTLTHTDLDHAADQTRRYYSQDPVVVDTHAYDALLEAQRRLALRSLSELVADLFTRARELAVISVPGDDSQALHVAPCMFFSLFASQALLAKNGRDPEIVQTPEFVELCMRWLKLKRADRRMMKKWVGEIITADSWEPTQAHDFSGLRVTIATPGLGCEPVAERAGQGFVNSIANTLTKHGASVARPVSHHPSDRTIDRCTLMPAADVLVVVHSGTSVRVGHQLNRAWAHGTPVLVIVCPGIGPISCAYKDTRFGDVTVERASTAREAADLVESYLHDRRGMFETLNKIRRSVLAETESEYARLRSSVRARIARGWPPGFALSETTAAHIISSPHAFSGTAYELIKVLTKLAQSEPPRPRQDVPTLRLLFSDEQLWEFDQLVQSGDIGASEEGVILGTAANEIVKASTGVAKRTRSFLGPDDWLGVCRSTRNHA